MLSQKKSFGNPCGGRGVSPHLNASSQHLYLSLLQLVSVFKFHTYDLDVVQAVVPKLNGIPSNQLKPRIRCGGAPNYEPRITQYIAENYILFFQLICGWLPYHSGDVTVTSNAKPHKYLTAAKGLRGEGPFFRSCFMRQAVLSHGWGGNDPSLPATVL